MKRYRASTFSSWNVILTTCASLAALQILLAFWLWSFIQEPCSFSDLMPLKTTAWTRRTTSGTNSNEQRASSLSPPVIASQAPEYALFNITQPCSQIKQHQPVHCSTTTPLSIVTDVPTLVAALQLCLAEWRCSVVIYNTQDYTAHLCPSSNNTQQHGVGVGDSSIEGYTATSDKVSTTTQQPSSSSHIWIATRQIRLKRDPCGPQGCATLPGAVFLPGFTRDITRLQQRYLPNYQLYHPALFHHLDQWYIALRGTNFTFCPWKKPPPWELGNQGGFFHSFPVVCPINLLVMTINPDDCNVFDNFNPTSNSTTTNTTTTATSEPVVVNWPAALLPLHRHPRSTGFEDGKGFSYRGKSYLIGSVYSSDVYLKDGKDWDAVLAHQRVAAVLLELSSGDMSSVVKATPLVCDGNKQGDRKSVSTSLGRFPLLSNNKQQSYTTGRVEKNWMPLISKDRLLFVTRLEPLSIISVDPSTGNCSPYFIQQRQPQNADSSSSSSVPPPLHSKPQPHTHNIQDTLPTIAYRNASRSFEATGTQQLRGNGAFLQITNRHYLGIVHRAHGGRYSIKSYLHHFILIEEYKEGFFDINWVSEPFKLPRRQGMKQLERSGGIQFAASLFTLHDRRQSLFASRESDIGSLESEDLYIGYSDLDCESYIIRLPKFFQRLPSFVGNGVGTSSLNMTLLL